MDATPDYQLAATRAARKFGIDPRIFLAQIRQESGFRPNVTSSSNAHGIAQFIPSTAKQYGVNLNDGRVTDDLEGAARYMRDLLRQNGGNYHRALSAYNSGKPDAYKDPSFAKGQTFNYVRTILGNAGSSPGPAARGKTATSSRTIPGTDNSQARQAAIAAFLGDKRADPVDFALQIKGLQDRPARTVTTTSSGPGGSSSAVKSRADAISKQKLPYSWGGGHAANVPAGTPLDCSGAVSKVLGINPRVSGDFANWGKPGRGSKVTVYYNAKHVFLEINGHFWGTSAANPGGGAGWIPRSHISPGYLAGFKARHAG